MRLRLTGLVVIAGAFFVLNASSGEASAPEPGSAELLWGDVNCSEEVDHENAVNGGDALGVLQHVVGGYAWPGGDVCWRYLYHFDQVVEADGVVVTWGDVNCSGRIDALDALAILRHLVGLAPSPKVEPCPELGTRVEIGRT